MSLITAAQIEQFREEGYFILDSAIPQHHIDLLRGECQAFIDKADALMDRKGTDHLGLNHRNSRYFVSNCFRDQPRLREFLFSDLMAEICQATLGEDAYLFWEQYVVKSAEAGKEFSWHQDSGYIGFPEHRRYLTCWCALDDMSEANGTVHLLPFSRAGIRTWVQHIRDGASGDKIGYFGDDPGMAAIVPAGSIVVFSSLTFHCSGANVSDRWRRSFLAQYTPEPQIRPDGRLAIRAEPFLKAGRPEA